MRRTPRRLIGTFIAVAALAALIPASAQALGFGTLAATPTNLQAGAHSNFNITIPLTSASDDIKNLTIGLPPGQVGDPNATPFCSAADLNNDACPSNTQVGNATTDVSVTVAGPITVPLSVTGNVYNVAPHPGEPARFGIALHALPVNLPVLGPVLFPAIILQSGVQLRSDFGLDTVVQNIPNTATVAGLSVPIDVTQLGLSLDGTAPGPPPKSFMRNPTSCGTHTTNFAATSYSGSTTTNPVHGSANFTTNGCANEDFSPAFTAEVGGPGQTTNGVPTTASTSILQDTDEAGLLNAVVKVPGDLNPNATIFFGSHCDQASFLAGTCPSNTIVGLATAASPLLSQPLVGNVELVTGSGPLPALGLDLKGQLHLLLQGAVDISNGNTVAFNGLPDIPISRFQLTFSNPPGLLGTARDICVPPAPLFHADFTGYNGATSSVDSAATVDGCGAGNGNGKGKGGTGAKCKKKAKKHHKHRAAESKKHHKKKHSCKKKKHKKHKK